MIKYPIPAYDKKSGEWRLNLDDKSDYESGPVEIIAGDFIRNNLYYPLEKAKPDGTQNHCHTFDEVIEFVIKHPKEFSIEDDPEYYSKQQIRFLTEHQRMILSAKRK